HPHFQIAVPHLHLRFFFITCNLNRGVPLLHHPKFALFSHQSRASSLLPSAPTVSCPDHQHAILLPEDGTTVSDNLIHIRIATYRRVSKSRAYPQPNSTSQTGAHRTYNSSMRIRFMRQFFDFFLVASLASGVHAEIHTLSLREAVDRALHQNPDIALARLDE